MAIQATWFGGRQVLVGVPRDLSAVNVGSPFAVLVAASCQEELIEVLDIAGGLLASGCREFCCVGVEAEALHDRLDRLIEEACLLDVLTTWHEDAVEGCEYFLFGAGGQGLILYGLISRHPELLDAMALAADAN